MVNTIFILDKTYNTTQILVGDKSSQRMFWDDLYTQEFDTGAETFEFSCYLDENVVEGNYVAFYYNNQYKLFTIMDMEQTHKKGRLVANCYCEIASLSLLNNYVREFSGDMNCIQFFEHILNGTDWHIGKYSTSLRDRVETIKVTKIESVWSLIEDYKDIFECEINVRVTYENGHITGKYIDIYSDGGLGSSTLKRFEYGRNVTGITKKKELYDWCTGVILDVDCDVSDTIIEEKDGYGFTKGAGDIILNDNANRMYNAGRNYVIGVYEGDETEPVEACINAWKQLKERSTPRFDYEVTTALTEDEYEEVHLGDTVYVVDRSYTPPLFLEARVGKLELSFTDRTQNKCVLTNYKEIKSKLLDADYIKLTGTITDIVNAFFPITSEGIADGAIVDGKIETTYFQQITADIVSAGIGAFEELYAQGMTVINADIENLKATNADIGSLKAKVAEIDTLINGHLTSDNIQSLILTADKVTVADAFIKNAMIDTISASKITAGRLNTSLVDIQSEDGGVQISGSLQQFRDSSGKVRIQIGKDANGDFTFALFSQDGVGVLIDENGIKEGAIGDGLIVDDMVSDNANIQGGKLDINSVITSINNGTTTINSNRIYLDEEGQSLKVAFEQLKTKVETIEDVTVDGDLSSIIEQVISNTTNINIMQGEISSLISNTTITKENGQVVQLKDEYNSTKNTVDSHTTKIGSLETTVNNVSSKQSSMELDLNGFRTEVSNTYATKGEVQDAGEANDNLIINGRFIGAEPRMAGSDMTPWYMWGAIQVYQNGAYNTINKNIALQMTSESEGGGIYQDVIEVKSNTELTLSFYCNWQQNVRQPFFDITYYYDGTRLDDSTYVRGMCVKGDNVLTFTTPNQPFTNFTVGFVSDGLVAGSNGEYVNWYLNKVKLEVGNVATPWVENINYIENTYTTKTEFQQTNEDFTFKIQQAGGYNLLKNSGFTNGTEYWTELCWDTNHSSNRRLHVMEAYCIWNNNHFAGLEYLATVYEAQGYIRGGFDSPYVYNLEPGAKYSFSCYASCGRVDELCIELCGNDFDGNYQNWGALWRGAIGNNTEYGTNYEGWTKIEFTFSAPSNAKYIFLRFWGNRHTEGDQTVSLMISQPCLVRGSIPLDWSPHASEIYDGIVKIDSRGLSVQQGNNKSVLDSEALNFYAGDVRYSRVKGGRFEFTDNGGTRVGWVGRSSWVNSGKMLSALNADYGHTVGISAQYGANENYSNPLMVSSQSGYVTGSDYFYHQGLNLSSPKVTGPITFRSEPTNSNTDLGLLGLQIYGSKRTEDGGFIGMINGNEEVRLNIMYGSEIHSGIIIQENADNNNRTGIHMYGPLDMHNYNISRAGWVNPVSATSTYTTRLLNEGSIENMTYGGTTFTEGELRYVHRETCHTVEEWDYNDEGVWSPLGVYYCYCELPVFMAENIELDYHVNIGKVGWGDYRVIEKNPYLFIVESQEEGFAFTWEVVAKRIDKTSNNVVIANEYITFNDNPLPNMDEEFAPFENNIQENIITGEE